MKVCAHFYSSSNPLRLLISEQVSKFAPKRETREKIEFRFARDFERFVSEAILLNKKKLETTVQSASRKKVYSGRLLGYLMVIADSYREKMHKPTVNIKHVRYPVSALKSLTLLISLAIKPTDRG